MVGETTYSPTIFYTRTRCKRDEELLYEVIHASWYTVILMRLSWSVY